MAKLLVLEVFLLMLIRSVYENRVSFVSVNYLMRF